MDGLIASHGGRIANTAGDSVLAEFGSAVDAVRCAMEAQDALAEANSGLPENRRINFRMGVHVGDVMVRAGDLFGDGVNITARLQTLAKAGGLCISAVTYDQVRKILPLSFADLGAQTVKNIEEPLRAFEVKAQAEAASLRDVSSREDRKPLALPDKPSIAVLPFHNMSGDPEQEYFADGMVEDIITALSRFKSLFVIARNSSFTYKGKAVEIKQVGRELGVRYVLEGSVRKAGGKVRITGQLIEAATGVHLWADRFDGSLEDVFELQDKVTSSVVASIGPRLEQAEIERSERKPTESLEAIDLFYRALRSLRRWTREGYEDASRLAQQAISLDPNFGASYGLILDCFTKQRNQGWVTDDYVTAQGKQYALRIIEVGGDDAYALSRAAHFFSIILRDVGTGEVIVDQAVAVNPNLAEAWRMRGWISVYLGRHEPALGQFNYSMRLNPLDPQIAFVETGLAWANFCLRRFETAASWAAKSLARDQNHVPTLEIAMVSYAMLDRIADAQIMMVRRHEAGVAPSISQQRKRMAHHRQEDVELYIEACRIAGMPE
jgi:TolB-like protein